MAQEYKFTSQPVIAANKRSGVYFVLTGIKSEKSRPRGVSMQLRHVLASLALTLAATPLTAPAASLYLMGGGYGDKNTDLWVNGLRKATGRDSSFTPNVNSTTNCSTNWATTPCPRVAVVTAASVDFATGLDAFQNDLGSGSNVKRGYSNLFQTHGMAARHITAHVDNYGTHSFNGNSAGDANLAIINQADIVFFSGGDQAKIARTFMRNDGTDTPLAAALRARFNNGNGNIVIAGDSAGNHILNTMMHGGGVSYGYLYFNATLHAKAITDWQTFYDSTAGADSLRAYDNGAKMKGLGFLPANVLSDTHFDSRSGRLGRLVAAMKNIGRNTGIGVDEDSGFLYNFATQTGKAFGSQHVQIVESANATYPTTSTYLKVNGLRWHYLTSGDTYHLGTRAVTSTKALISTPYYSSYKDSADIFAATETAKTATRVVDQSGAYNIGNAPAPVYSSNPKYPTNAPTIKVKFYDEAATRGYYSGGKYTVQGLRIDIY
jgi:cyanophycinase